MIRNQTAADEYREIAGRFTALVEAVPDDATWKRQSPVPEWTARDIVRHLVVGGGGRESNPPDRDPRPRRF